MRRYNLPRRFQAIQGYPNLPSDSPLVFDHPEISAAGDFFEVFETRSEDEAYSWFERKDLSRWINFGDEFKE